MTGSSGNPLSLATDRITNNRRGVVLIGHSQGTRTLIELLKRDIDGKPEQKKLVSALLIGIPVMVPAGADHGGTLATMPLCRASNQTGCVVAYSTFRETAPPPGNARFGRSTVAGTDVACVDVVSLSGQPVRAMLSRHSNLLGRPTSADPEWQQQVAEVATQFVDMPGLLKARCVKDGPNHYMSLAFDTAARGTRTTNIPVDLVAEGKIRDDWGLHLVDVNMFLGNLIELVRQQGIAYTSRQN